MPTWRLVRNADVSIKTMSVSAAISIPKRVVVALLAAFYLVAFVLSPYWRLIQPDWLAVLLVAAVIGMGAVWSYQSASNTAATIELKSALMLAALLLGVILLNFRALTSVIPWRGDESGHITVTVELVRALSVQFAISIPLLFGFLVFAVARKSRRMFLVSALGEVVLLFLFFQTGYFAGLDLSRWPYVNYWFFAIAPFLSSLVWSPYHEALYRIIPALSATALAWILTRQLRRSDVASSFLWGLAVVTIPIVFYYSSILYIEMPAVCLMTIVCLQARRLLCGDFDEIRQTGGWYALVLLGFIKETVIVFLLCFLVFRIACSLHRLITERHAMLPQLIMARLRQECVLAFCVLYPIGLYLVLRAYAQLPRSFTPDLLRLADPVTYKLMAQSSWEQFGLFCFLFLGGLAVLAWKRDYLGAGLLLFIAVVGSLVFSIDSGGAFAGYSRFNLFVLPPVLAGSAALANWLGQSRKIAIIGLSCLAIALNLIMSPIYPDGTKVPLWGNYVTDTGEHYYPYDQALPYLQQNYRRTSVVFSGMHYPYPLWFYFHQLRWFPKNEARFIAQDELENESSALSDVLSQAKQDGFGLVLWQVKGQTIPATSGSANSCLTRVFRNQAHILILFALAQNAAAPCISGGP